ncbi:MAG: polysaccharide biosynthesis/export family protein [Planctomycetota bacterium]|nr:polysaccharide biosynthesis/export family protein [Planctomycetota bacterium]
MFERLSSPAFASTLPRRGSRASTLLALCGGAVLATLSGCEVDSFMDPSKIGRWEHTPVRVPILPRLASIEDAEGEFTEVTDVTREDLLPAPQAYRVGPGDALEVAVFELIERNQWAAYPKQVDSRGMIDIPQLGEIYVSGKTVEQVRLTISDAARRFIQDPIVDISVTTQRSQLFNIIGAVERPGPYFVPGPEYRLLEAITAGGRFSDTLKEIFVIRQVPLSEAVGGPGTQSVAPRGNQTGQQTPGEAPRAPIDVIDELMRPPESEPSQPGQSQPGQPQPAAIQPSVFARAASQPESTPGGSAEAPPIELVDEPARPNNQSNQTNQSTTVNQPGSSAPRSPGAGTWVFLNGRWVQVMPTSPQPQTLQPAPNAGSPATPAPAPSNPAADLLTQRIIRVPLQELVRGDLRYNIVVRPGDTIRFPATPEGLVYMEGEVARPGPYALPTSGELTLMRAIVAAGGLGSLAIPERVDLTRRVGKDMQATIRLDLRAIKEQTQPDIYMKPDDIVNVGTNFWATPLAVLRSGLRVSYGFGFLVDRNFGNDLFGAPPTNRNGE